MRLLNTQTGHFYTVASPTDVSYAILSHRWDTDGEQTFQEVCTIQARYRETSRALASLQYLGIFLLGVLPCGDPPSPPRTGAAPLDATRMRLMALWTIWVPLALAWAATSDRSSVLADYRLSRKIRDACAYVFAHGHRYLWINSCCIDKTSSTELSEAINSMYRWYELADVCYAYLSDVSGPGVDREAFRQSLWHTRGWTLQELLAPDLVVFLSSRWVYIGTKSSLAGLLEEQLGINRRVLAKVVPVRECCAAEIMSWAAFRVTTREEDMAYCLIGLFGVQMPTLYGERGKRAFVRLQQEIWKVWLDPFIFAWNNNKPASISDITEYYLNTDFVMTTRTWTHARVKRACLMDYTSHYASDTLNFVHGHCRGDD